LAVGQLYERSRKSLPRIIKSPSKNRSARLTALTESGGRTHMLSASTKTIENEIKPTGPQKVLFNRAVF